MATNKSSASEAVNEIKDGVEHLVEATKDATVTAIKKADDEVFDIEEDNSFGAKTKRLFKDKRVIAGAVTTILLTAGVIVARRRNEIVEDQNNETPEA